MDSSPPARLHFDAVLHPHRSLGPRGFWLLMAAIAVISFAAGVAFALRGAWPVLGFFGLDVLAVYVAFRLSYRSGRRFETVQLSDQALVVRRVEADGRAQRWSFQPYWVRLAVAAHRNGSGHVLLSSHGRAVAVGAFLTAEERAQFATALKRALDRLRAGPASA